MEVTSQNPFATYNHAEMKAKVGVSNCKIFDGEDLTSGNRKRLQQLQQMDWIQQQIQEKNERKQLEKDTNMAYEQQTLHITRMAQALEKCENDKRHGMTKATKQTNVAQTFSQNDKRNYEHQIDQSGSKNHINYCMTNDFQTENTQTCQSMLAQHRVIPYHWKGMNEEQRKDILLKQDQQKHENQTLRSLTKEEQRLYDLQTEHQRHQQINLDRERERQLRGTIIATKEYNLNKKQEHNKQMSTQYGGN